MTWKLVEPWFATFAFGICVFIVGLWFKRHEPK